MPTKNRTPFAWAAVVVSALLLLGFRVVYPELLRLTALLGVLFVGSLAWLGRENRKSLRGRAAAYGLNSAITVALVVGLVGVANFMAARYPKKLDLTKEHMHSFSDQTEKLMKGLTKPVKAILFAKLAQKEQFRPLLDNYKALSPKFEVEYVDPDREPARAKQAGIKKYGTLQLIAGAREKQIEEPTEEKVTNALVRLLKDKTNTLCAITGHGERSFTSTEAEGYAAAQKGLEAQACEVKEINLLNEKKVPDTCDAIAILGPTKPYFGPELEAVNTYIVNGGRAIIALDLNVKAGEFVPELSQLLASWYVKPAVSLIVDPVSKMTGVDASVPVLPTFSKDHPIVRDFTTREGQLGFFAILRPLEILPNPPAALAVTWLAQTTPNSFEVSDFKALLSGQVDETGKKHGPFNAAVAVEGKKPESKSTRKTRLVAFGSANFADNQWGRYGSNLDFMLNAVSWVLDDENQISIRAKEEGAGKIELSQRQGSLIMLLTVVLIPLAIAATGVVIWAIRRRL
jgi:ABC-type uncharacterized transport system involved in gliding motility auxiliary subunit